MKGAVAPVVTKQSFESAFQFQESAMLATQVFKDVSVQQLYEHKVMFKDKINVQDIECSGMMREAEVGHSGTALVRLDAKQIPNMAKS